MGFPPDQTYQRALFAAGIPATAFITNHSASEHKRLKAFGVAFRGEPKPMGPSPPSSLRTPAATSSIGSALGLTPRFQFPDEC